MEFKNYYEILGVEKTATPEEIKKSYKKLARKYHPDVSKEKDAEQKFKDLGEAYEVLKDPAKRAEYDQMQAMGADRGGQFRPPPGWDSATHFYEGESSGEFSDFFEAMFGRNGGFRRARSGGAQHMSMRGEDIRYELALLLEEAYSGTEQQLEYRVPDVDEHGLISHRIHRVKVKIPAGAAAGSILRIKGHGAPGIGGADAGDLLLTIRLAEHPLYTVDGKNLSLIVPITPWEAALGAKVTIPTLKSKTKVNVPAGSQSGQKLRLAGLGLPGNPAGDFYVVLKIVMPDKVTPEARALYEELAKDTSFNPRSAWE